jgi:hypothetical protein
MPIPAGWTILSNKPQMPQSFPLFMADRQGDKVMTFHQQIGAWVWLNELEYKTEMKRFKNLMKKGRLNIEEENNLTYEYEGVKWYSLVFNLYDENGEEQDCMDIGSMDKFGVMVDGFSYYFINKADRDNIYKHLTKK